MSEIKVAPLSPEQREEILQNRLFPTGADAAALLSHIAYLEEEARKKDEALKAVDDLLPRIFDWIPDYAMSAKEWEDRTGGVQRQIDAALRL